MHTSCRIGITLMALVIPHVQVLANTGEASPPLDMAAVRTEVCHSCERSMRNIEADLVITTALSDGGYIAVWQDRKDGHAYGRRYVSDGSPRGARFRIAAHVEDGILPVIVTHRDGGFAARWSQGGRKYEQRFDVQGAPLGEALAK
jgi:hypothetical protein